MLQETAIFFGVFLAAIYGWALVAFRRRERLNPADLALDGRRLSIDGISVHYVEEGDPSTPALLMIHGLGSAASDFRPLIARLAERYRVIAPDLPGFGFSERPRKYDYSPARQTGILLSLLDRLGIDRAIVVGSSLGGSTAVEIALTAPERVRTLVLIAPVIEQIRGRVPPWRVVWLLIPLLSSALAHRRLNKMRMRTAVHHADSLTNDLLAQRRTRLRIRGSAIAMGRAVVSIARGPAPDIASIVPPTLVLWGQGDRWFASDYGETLVSRIPRSALVLIPAAGHLLIQEQPGDIADAIHAFDEREATLAQPPAAISSVMPA